MRVSVFSEKLELVREDDQLRVRFDGKFFPSSVTATTLEGARKVLSEVYETLRFLAQGGPYEGDPMEKMIDGVNGQLGELFPKAA